ncbi:PH domain-containing protein [Zhihengliuella sp.]|uniref:PH domain-containing protein n=1 Tax=Zhihengliuella sp. TaxID=1954483 RepID=UPI0028116392|nr:PH domain-containing protein [Zhihengliuella sp.]
MRLKLGDAERVIVKTRQHPRVLVRPVVLMLLVIAATGFGLGYLTREDLPDWLVDLVPILQPGIAGLGLLLVLAWTVTPYVRWIRTRYCLTNRRIIIRVGGAARAQRELPLILIRELVVRQSVMQRGSGAGHLVLMTSNGGTVLKNTPSVHRMRELTLEAIEALPRRVGFQGDEGSSEGRMDWAMNGDVRDGVPGHGRARDIGAERRMEMRHA